MINTVSNQPLPCILSNTAQKAYDKLKALIRKIFSLLKDNNEQKNLKEEFYNSYIDFACKLDEEGFDEESNSYMAICFMYYDLMDRPEELIAHESFFIDLFNSFDEILYIKINKPDEFEEKYDEFMLYRNRMQQYYYTKLAIPSPHYNQKTCEEIISHLVGDLDG